MIEATELKNGTTFLLSGKPCKVVKYTHQKIGRGGANVKVSIRNLTTGALEEKTFNSSEKFEEISTIKNKLQYLYKDEKEAYFINSKTFEQISIPLSIVGDDIYFCKEGEEINVLFWGDKPLSVEIGPKVNLKVVDTMPGVKGNSATNIYKPAVLENGLKIKVPLFINNGDKIRVDTRSITYVERVN